jgi:hypothetical protein
MFNFIVFYEGESVMKVKSTIIMIAVIALLSAVPALAQDLNLIADGGDPLTEVDVGGLYISNDGTNLVIVFYLDVAGWEFVESHLHVAESLAAIPQTGNGNPKVGKFDYNQDDADPAEDDWQVYTIPLADIGDGVDVGNPIFIAAHAVVRILVDDMGTLDPLDDIYREETAWGACSERTEFADDRNWATYIETTVPAVPD